ncbi:ribose import ATP-binding protein RbsA [Comamonadaceae bacterium OS-4]|nr:ribose import ATP-binding protein RbsA [Comamonadaceae bacterium OS-4]
MTAPGLQGAPIFTVEGITKRYASNVLSGVSLSLRPGEVLALTGENGAGKSTMSKIVAGLVDATEGTMHLAGRSFAPKNRREAEDAGVRMVMQELSLVSTLTVAENLLIDALPNRGRWSAHWIDRKALHQAASQQLAKIGIQGIAPDCLVSELGIGQQQMVEIARNLQDGTKILILDEPTAMLTPRETQHLFAQIERLKAQGVAIIYVSHRLEELRKIADTLAVLRDGVLVKTCPMHEVTEDDIIALMVGRAVEQDMQKPRRPQGPCLLKAQGLGRGMAVKSVSLDLHAGEVFGLAGLVGSGRTELVRLLFGADRADTGDITLAANAHRPALQVRAPGWRSPQAAIAAGIGLVTEDRKSQGLLLTQSIAVNTSLGALNTVSRRGWLHLWKERTLASDMVKRLRVRSHSVDQAVGTLSGGNQQKVIFARWLHKNCEVLLLDEPTRGVDVGARADIYAEIEAMTQAQKAVLMVSSDLRELMQMCDRIGVMSHGRLVTVLERGQWSEKSLLDAAFSETGADTPVAAVCA